MQTRTRELMIGEDPQLAVVSRLCGAKWEDTVSPEVELTAGKSYAYKGSGNTESGKKPEPHQHYSILCLGRRSLNQPHKKTKGPTKQPKHPHTTPTNIKAPAERDRTPTPTRPGMPEPLRKTAAHKKIPDGEMRDELTETLES